MPDRIVKSAAFEFKIRGRIVAGVDSESGRVRVSLQAAAVDEGKKIIACSDGGDAEVAVTFTPTLFLRASPRKAAPTDEEIAGYVERVQAQFEASAPCLATSVTFDFLNGAANLQDDRGDADAYDEEEIIAEQLREFEYQLRQALGSPRPGTRSKWSAITLRRAVRDALADLRPSRLRTLEGVADLLKVRHPDKAPKTGEALRKLLMRLKLDWQELKDEADT